METINDELIKINMDMCYELIPNYLIPIKPIIIDIYIANKKLRALIDTGATVSVISNKTIELCGLEYIVDSNNNIDISGIHSTNKSYGKIWYIDIEINKYTIPCSLFVVDNDNNIFDIILGLNFLTSNNININFATKEIIFSTNFKTSFNNYI